MVYTNFQDALGELEEIELGGASNGHVDLVRYRENIRLYLADHQDHATIQRLRRNKQLTALDLSELERILLKAASGDQGRRRRRTRPLRTASGGLGSRRR